MYVNFPTIADLILRIFDKNIIIMRKGLSSSVDRAHAVGSLFRLDIMYLVPEGTKLGSGSHEMKDLSKKSLLRRCLALMGNDIGHQIELYLAMRTVKHSCALD